MAACITDTPATLAHRFSMEELLFIARRVEKEHNAFRTMQRRYYWDPLGWILEYVDIKLPAYHIKTLGMIGRDNNKICIYGPHGLGKSVLASLIILWAGSVSYDCKIITTASAWAQLEKFLWPEVHKWYARVNWAKVGTKPELLSLQAKFSPQVHAFAIAPGRPENMEGGHAQRVVYIFDESKTIEAGYWEAAEGAFSTPGDHLQIALSTPGDTSGVFYSICSRQHGYEGWNVRHVSLREAIRAGRITLGWAREKRRQWGVSNAVYLNRVWGIFAMDSADSVIPLSWVMRAVARWHAWSDKGGWKDGPVIVGADTAGQGVDVTSFCKRWGSVLGEIERHPKSRPMELAGMLHNILGAKGFLNIDASYGEGAGTADRLLELEDERGRRKFHRRVNCINFGAKCERTDKSGLLTFANIRAAMWWNMRELLDPDEGSEICLPDDPLLIGDLTAVRRKTRSDGRILLESKEDIKLRIGRSPDDGDACCMAFFADRCFDELETPTLSYADVKGWF
jgi:hypothetical protein